MRILIIQLQGIQNAYQKKLIGYGTYLALQAALIELWRA